MEHSRPHGCSLLDLQLRQVDAATPRFALEAPPTAGEFLALVLIGPCAADKVDLARRLHIGSPRSLKPFVHIDCRHSAGMQFAALNGTIRSTRPIAGADDPPRHFLRFANGGTIFFDHWRPDTAAVYSHLFAEFRYAHETPLAAADPFALDVVVTVAVDARWTDAGNNKCLMSHWLGEYVAYLKEDAQAELLTAN